MLWQLFLLTFIAKPLSKWRMRQLPIKKYPASVLRKPCKEWTDFTPKGIAKLEKMVVRMMRVLHSQKWGSKLGISANQAGYGYRVCIALGRVLVNPEFTPTKAPPITMMEGCYSLGMDAVYEVPRASYGWLKYQDTKGEWHDEKVKGVNAIVVQHELAHLNGRSCVEDGKRVASPKKVLQ